MANCNWIDAWARSEICRRPWLDMNLEQCGRLASSSRNLVRTKQRQSASEVQHAAVVDQTFRSAPGERVHFMSLGRPTTPHVLNLESFGHE